MNDGESSASLAEDAFTSDAAAGGIIFPCATRIQAVKDRKERILAYEAELKAVREEINIKSSVSGTFEGAVVGGAIEGLQAIAGYSEHDVVEQLKSKHLKPGDEDIIIAYKDKSSVFWRHVIDNLTFKSSYKHLSATLFERRTFEKHRITSARWIRFTFFTIDALVNWIGTVIQLLFPVVMFLGTFFLVPYCY